MEIVGGKKTYKRIGGVDKEGKGLVLVELEGLDRKREMMTAKNKLKGESY
ncbi:GSCOCG00011603001-RA-CDS [Cotesia congregata]|nr:GSCOCG00011603001-RA-CDS [Cotesia congregata]